MRSAATRPDSCQNWLCFKDFCMEESSFIWAEQGAGHYNPDKRARQTLWCSRLDRNITTSRYNSTIYKGGSTMDKRLKTPDLDKIEGLLALVQEQGWDEHGNMRVGDFAHHLFNLYRCTHSRLGETLRLLDDKGHLLHAAESRLRDAEHRLSEADYHLYSTQRELDDMARRLYENERLLSDTRRDLEDARTRLNENRRSSAPDRSGGHPLRSGGTTRDSRGPLTLSEPDDDSNTEGRRDGQGRTNTVSLITPAPGSGRSPGGPPGDNSSGRRGSNTPVIPRAKSPFFAPALGSASSPARARAKSPFHLNFSKFPAGNLPWSAPNVTGKRSHATMSEHAGASNGNTAIGRSGAANGSDPRAGNYANLASLLRRHPSNTAFEIRARQQQNGNDT